MAFKRVNYCQKELHVWCFIVPQSASVFIVVFWANIFEEPDLVKKVFFWLSFVTVILSHMTK